MESFKQYKDRSVSLDNLLYNKFGRPFLNHKIDFNISHSGGYVICAITDKAKVGIDIEKIRSIALSDFEKYMNPEEWKAMQKADNKYEKFYEYWTIKESVMKANGRGLSIPLTDIIVDDMQYVYFYNDSWFLKEIVIDPGYKCYLAANSKHLDIKIGQVYEFIN